MAEVTLTGGHVALVDDRDAPFVSQWRWHVQDCGGGLLYARRNTTRADRTTHSIYMHRWIALAPPGSEVDHINHNGLDNRLANLRITTKAGNQQNQRNAAYKGVCWIKAKEMWRVTIQQNHRRFEVGYFQDEDTAWKARRYVLGRLRGGEVDPTFNSRLLSPSIRSVLDTWRGE